MLFLFAVVHPIVATSYSIDGVTSRIQLQCQVLEALQGSPLGSVCWAHNADRCLHLTSRWSLVSRRIVNLLKTPPSSQSDGQDCVLQWLSLVSRSDRQVRKPLLTILCRHYELESEGPTSAEAAFAKWLQTKPELSWSVLERLEIKCFYAGYLYRTFTDWRLKARVLLHLLPIPAVRWR